MVAQDYAPQFWKGPRRFFRFLGYNRPYVLLAFGLGLGGPLLAIFGTPLRRKYLYDDTVPFPASYPLPNRPRDLELKGFEDE